MGVGGFGCRGVGCWGFGGSSWDVVGVGVGGFGCRGLGVVGFGGLERGGDVAPLLEQYWPAGQSM